MENLEIGQVWVGDAEGAAPPLLCVIGAIDDMETNDGPMRIVSVSISPHPRAKEVGWTAIGHLPITEQAFLDSRLKLAPNPVAAGPQFHEGYAMWRQKFELGEAGVFTIAISDTYMSVVSVAAKKAANG